MDYIPGNKCTFLQINYEMLYNFIQIIICSNFQSNLLNWQFNFRVYNATPLPLSLFIENVIFNQ